MAGPSPSELTLFTTCKPFVGEAAVLQENALLTWRDLGLNVIICGPEAGAAEAARAFGARHIPGIATNDKGTPLISSIFGEAVSAADTRYMAYINADILLTPSVTKAMTHLIRGRDPEKALLMSCRRRNIPLGHALPQGAANWQGELKSLDKAYGSWDQSNAIDLFLFNRGLFDEIIPLVVGHMQWDNWLMWKAHDRGADIIDASMDAALLHPIHGYTSDGSGLQARSQGAQAVRNRQLAAGHSMDLNAATTHVMKDGNITVRDAEDRAALATACAPDLDKEFWAGIEYLSATGASRSAEEMLDCCRTILWRHARFFPFFEAASPGHDDIVRAVSGAKAIRDAAGANAISRAADIIQDLVAGDFVRRLTRIQEGGRELHIWGAGGAGLRLLSLLRRHGVPIAAFCDRDAAKAGTLIDGVPVVAADPGQTGDKPFIAIASMHASEIAADLTQAGWRLYDDFSG